MQRLPLILISLCWSILAFAQTEVTLQPTSTIPPAAKMDQFQEYELFELDHQALYGLWQSDKDLIQFNLQAANEVFDFEVYRYDMRSKGYALVSGSREAGNLVLHPRKPAAQFKGLVNRNAETTAIFTIDEGYVLGYWQTVTGKEYYLEPLWRFWPEAPRNLYVRYEGDKISRSQGTCGTVAELHRDHEQHSHARSSAGECIEVEIALASDFELFQDFNSATAVENFMLNTLALVQSNYDSQIGDNEFDDELKFEVTNTVIATSEGSDPWTNDTNSEVLLPNFRDWGNAGNFSNAYDVASLWSGRNFDGTTIGLAYIGVICSNSRYNVLENYGGNSAQLRVLWAHELGHNFNADHDATTGFIMSPSVNVTTTWSSTSRSVINAHYQSRDCLANCPQSAPVASFMATNTGICPGSSITFTNTTTGTTSSFQWSFPGGTPATSTELNPTVTYNNAGTYTVTLTATNSAGSNSSQQQITVGSGQTDIRFFENFEDNTLGNLTASNPDGGITWSTRATGGNNGSISAFLNNYSYNAAGQVDGLLLPVEDLSDVSSLRLQFEYAYVRYNANLKDQLRVRVIAGGNSTTVFTGDENGSQNFATAPDQTTVFTPSSADDWCFNGPSCVDLDLSAFDGNPSVQIAIENVNGYGNSMYVDNILLTAICTPAVLPVEWLSFEATAAKERAELTWVVNQDELHEGFAVERAMANNPGQWTKIGYVEGKEGAAESVAYKFFDYEVAMNESYLYRLRQQDVDGNEDLSVIRSVSFGKFERKASIWPNPNQGQFTLLTASNTGHYELLDSQGRQIQKGIIASYRTAVNIDDLKKGVYFIRILSQNGDADVLRVLRQ